MYIFFVRHFNDIDHLTPVAWKLHKDNYQVAVFCMNLKYDIQQDYRLRFLRDQGVTVDYIYGSSGKKLGPIHQFLYALIRLSYKIQRKLMHEYQGPFKALPKLLVRLTDFAGKKLYKITRKFYYDQHWARSILMRTDAQVICFDYIMPNHYVVDAFLKAAGQMSIPALALPHGVQLYTNEITKPKATDTRRFAKFNRFDYIVAPNQLRKDILVRAGISGGKIPVLGSARYCRDWIEQNSKIVPKGAVNIRGEANKLKVVLMPSKPQCRQDMERLFDSCRLIAELDGIDAVIKPHTRTRNLDQFGDYPLPDVSHMLTADLCGWADALLVVGSSVMTEALVRGKPVLYAKYLHDNITLFEELGACWILHDETELKNALLALQADKAHVPYSKESVAAYVSQVVHGGNSNRDVLEAYEKFIVNCALNPEPSVFLWDHS